MALQMLHKPIIHHPRKVPVARRLVPVPRHTSSVCVAPRRQQLRDDDDDEARLWEEENQRPSSSGAPLMGPISKPSTQDVRVALGIDKEDDWSKSASRKSFMTDVVEKLEEIADTLTEYTERDVYQARALQFVMVLFPVWLLYVLVAAEAIRLPFPLPFL